MKRIFLEAGIPTARQHIVSDLEAGEKFVEEVGYPVVVKPDIGVGANGAMKDRNREDLLSFYSDLPEEPYVMEEFLFGDICTYDAIIGTDISFQEKGLQNATVLWVFLSKLFAGTQQSLDAYESMGSKLLY